MNKYYSVEHFMSTHFPWYLCQHLNVLCKFSQCILFMDILGAAEKWVSTLLSNDSMQKPTDLVFLTGPYKKLL